MLVGDIRLVGGVDQLLKVADVGVAAWDAGAEAVPREIDVQVEDVLQCAGCEVTTSR